MTNLRRKVKKKILLETVVHATPVEKAVHATPSGEGSP